MFRRVVEALGRASIAPPDWGGRRCNQMTLLHILAAVYYMAGIVHHTVAIVLLVAEVRKNKQR
jgi:H+/Cl- antiporter ClcA